MKRDMLATRMQADLQIAADIRHRFAAGAAAAARQTLRQFQAVRLAPTYADLLANARFSKATQFFLTDLYGPETNLSRYEEAQLAMSTAVRLLPLSGLETLADAWQLDALSESLDAAMIETLGSLVHDLTPARYATAYAAVGRAGDRTRQIELIGALARELERFGHKPLALTTLRMMREPARLAGFADLQRFLENGLDALQCMGGVSDFIDIVTAREHRLMLALLAGEATLLNDTARIGNGMATRENVPGGPPD